MKTSNLAQLPGIGPKRLAALFDAKIYSMQDLLNYYPRAHHDRSDVKAIDTLIIGAVNTIRMFIKQIPESVQLNRKGKHALNITKLTICDTTGCLDLIWYNQPFLKKQFKPHHEYMFTGKVIELYDGRVQMMVSEFEAVHDETLSGGRIVPIYTPPKGFSQKTFRKLIHTALHHASGQTIHENLPQSIVSMYGLITRDAAVRNIHFPINENAFFSARMRLVFEELFFMQATLFKMKKIVKSERGINMQPIPFDAFFQRLPFSLTDAQSEVLQDICTDLYSGQRMNRLIQGDVGSGKTAVAMAAAYVNIMNGYQMAIMAPTEVLASQHMASFNAIFEPLGFNVVLLTGSLTAKQKRAALAQIQDGTAQIIIGTHALIQNGVLFHKLGLVITDEQHRFGVNQRLELSVKAGAVQPHILVMTATPIPRSLGMILYGDLDISIIDQLPPGRVPIKTYCVRSNYRTRVHNFIQAEHEKGRQSYIICPAIDENPESERLSELNNVINYTKDLKTALPSLNIAYLHGRMKPDEKQAVMDAFKSGAVHVIVSTTVIEVGVHVDNASLMIVENAERFGLSQLHQLRGRVGRSEYESFCILITDSKNKITKERMQSMVSTTDGFQLAELDLQTRGAGDFFGTLQHGLPGFRIANLITDKAILLKAQQAAQALISRQIVLTEAEQTQHEQWISHTFTQHGGVL